VPEQNFNVLIAFRSQVLLNGFVGAVRIADHDRQILFEYRIEPSMHLGPDLRDSSGAADKYFHHRRLRVRVSVSANILGHRNVDSFANRSSQQNDRLFGTRSRWGCRDDQIHLRQISFGEASDYFGNLRNDTFVSSELEFVDQFAKFGTLALKPRMSVPVVPD
jgi:hypothetical protein